MNYKNIIKIISFDLYIRICNVQKYIKNKNMFYIKNIKFKVFRPLNLFLKVLFIIFVSYNFCALFSKKYFSIIFLDNFFFWFDYLI